MYIQPATISFVKRDRITRTPDYHIIYDATETIPGEEQPGAISVRDKVDEVRIPANKITWLIDTLTDIRRAANLPYTREEEEEA